MEDLVEISCSKNHCEEIQLFDSTGVSQNEVMVEAISEGWVIEKELDKLIYFCPRCSGYND